MMPNKQVILKVDNLSKQYGKSNEGQKASAFWALREVSFEVNRGDIIGIIGGNGSGKSTLLKILSGITKPTEGQVILDGRVASVLDVGAGFHPDLTGRENVHLRGELLGMSRKEVDRVFDRIVEFSEIGPFIDTAVKFYSDGMFLRLAFAIIIHLDFDVLLLDEVMQVGDQHFRKKTEEKILELANNQFKTLIIVSHNLGDLMSIANRFIVLESGRIKTIGKGSDLVRQYIADGERSKVSDLVQFSDSLVLGYRLLNLTMNGATGEPKTSFHYLEPMTITLSVMAETIGHRLPFLVQICDCFDHVIMGMTYLASDSEFRIQKPGVLFDVEGTVNVNQLNFGSYYVSVLKIDENFNISPFCRKAMTFTISRRSEEVAEWHDNNPAPIRPTISWKVSEK